VCLFVCLFVVCLYRREATSGESFDLSRRDDTHIRQLSCVRLRAPFPPYTHTRARTVCVFFFFFFFFLDRGGGFVSSRVGFFSIGYMSMSSIRFECTTWGLNHGPSGASAAHPIRMALSHTL
jgi:hypothetical protein